MSKREWNRLLREEEQSYMADPEYFYLEGDFIDETPEEEAKPKKTKEKKNSK